MLRIQRITNDAYQKQTLFLEDGSQVSITMRYRPGQDGWFFDEITYDDFVLQGIRITNQPNMLRQWQNKLPFGIFCETVGNREPTQLDDFYSEASKLFLLTEAEVLEYSEYLKTDV